MIIEMKTKGRLVLPVEVRRKLGLAEGDKLHVEDEDGRVVLRSLAEDPVGDFCGMLAGKGSAADLLADRGAERTREGAKHEAHRRRSR